MDRMGHSSTRAALIYLHAREERGHSIAKGMDAMVAAAKVEKSKAGRPSREAGKGHAGGTTGKTATRKDRSRKHDQPDDQAK
jgi:hypothetical protein